jgi:hypothetical protein
MTRVNLLAALGVAALSFAPATMADCTREKLLDGSKAYIAAQSSGKLDELKKLFTPTGFTYLENNGQVNDLSKGVINKALKIDHSKSTADIVACASYTELVAQTPHPYVIGVQIRHDEKDMKIKLVDVISATDPALFFNATATLGYFQQVGHFRFLTPSDRNMPNR